MPKYIDADKVVKWSYSEPRYSDSVNDRTDLRDFLLSLPTVSPDEVRGMVHCGECKFWRRPPSCEGLARCETGETGIRYRSKNDFCSRGAKMEASEDA